MALIKCPECGRDNVSEHAEVCPECGFNIYEYYKLIRVKERKQAVKEKIKKPKIIICFIALLAILVATFFAIIIINKIQERKAIISIQKFDSLKWGASKDEVHSMYGTPKKTGYAKITNYNFWGETDYTHSEYYELFDAKICNKSGELYVQFYRGGLSKVEWKCKFSDETKASKFYNKLAKICENEFGEDGEEATWGENLYEVGVAWLSQSFNINDYYIQVYKNKSEVLLLFDTDNIWTVKSREL